jgi:putative DNA primase/helicase
MLSGAKLLNEVRDSFRRFVSLPEGAAEPLALWVVHTHALGAAVISPLLTVISPVKRCGKTVLLRVLAALVRAPLFVSNISPAALFRAADASQPTLLVDEADSFLAMSNELRGILNAGHTRDTAFVFRVVGGMPVRFSTWCPKAIALIGRLPATLEDRAILIPMRRRAPEEGIAPLRLDRIRHELEPLQGRIVRWVEQNLEKLNGADPELPDGLHDRARDNWRPLIAIADAAGGAWPGLARRSAVLLSEAADEGELAPAVQLLADLRDLFAERGATWLASSEIVKVLATLEDRPWPEWRGSRAIRPKAVATLLRPFGISPRQERIGPRSVRGYALPDFGDAFRRYLPPRPEGGVPDVPDVPELPGGGA